MEAAQKSKEQYKGKSIPISHKKLKGDEKKPPKIFRRKKKWAEEQRSGEESRWNQDFGLSL